MEHNDQNAFSAEMEDGSSQIMEDSAANSPGCNSLEPKHKIFLSHSGGQKDFVEQLCHDLETCHRFPFFDKRRTSLPIGEAFPKLIFDAIRQCHVGVLVLSEEFFEKTKWPMLELVAMVKELKKGDSRIKLVPVFYHISREQWLDFTNRTKWILKWEEWANEDKRIKVDEWREALDKLKSINGLVINKYTSAMECRGKIVKEVCELVPAELRWDDSHVQGRLRLCTIICKTINQQEQQNGVKVMGLYGMGGIGKTTICKAMCNEMFQKFQGRVCHVELNNASEVELLREVLRRFTDTRHELLDELNVDQCRDQLKRCNTKGGIFLALDNVSNNLKVIRQAKTYLGAKWGKGSIVIVTARSLNELMFLNQYLDENSCMEFPKLEKEEAASLFLSHVAIGHGMKIEMDKGLVGRCVERCCFSKGKGMGHHYIPLALQVLGEQLGNAGYDRKLWDAQLTKIDTFDIGLFGNKHPIFSILRSSYDSLPYGSQMLFMDVALFLPTFEVFKWRHNYNLFEWLSMVHGSNVKEMMKRLEDLKRKSLLENLGNGITRIGMHDLWREFCVAESKVVESGDQRWLYSEEERGELGNICPYGSRRVNAKRMCFLNESSEYLNGVQLGEFVNVSVLKLDVRFFLSPSGLDLDLTGLKHLKSLDLSTSRFITKCVGFESLKNLAFLRWQSYDNASLPCIEEIGRLTKLQVVDIRLPEGGELPDLSMLVSLQVVSFTSCDHVVTIRGLTSKLTNLRYLKLGNRRLQECPGLGELCALEELDLSGCWELEELPCLQLLTKLRILDISGCYLLKAVPGLSDLVALEELRCRRTILASLPDMRKLTELRILRCLGLSRLRELNLCELPDLIEIDISECISLTRLTCRGPLGALKVFNLTLCTGLEKIPDLGNFPQLQELYLDGCASLMTLTSSVPVRGLRILGLEGCSSLSALPEQLSRSLDLRTLRMQGSGIVLSVEDIRKLKASCERLVMYPSFARSKYDRAIETTSNNRDAELNDMEINAQSQCYSRRLPDNRLLEDKVTKLVYTNAGGSLLALTSYGIHKLWDWGIWSSNRIGSQATASIAPQLKRPLSGRVMINDLNVANREEVMPCLALSKNDGYVISASGGKVYVFVTRTKELLTTREPPSTATSLAFYPYDYNIIAIGMEDSTIQIVNVRMQEAVCTLKGHQKRITGLAFSNSLGVMISLGADAQLCSWRTERWTKRLSKFAPLQPDETSQCMGDIRVQFQNDEVHFLVVGESQLAVFDASKMDHCLRQWVPETFPFTAAISDAVYSCDSQLVYASFIDGSVGVFDAENLWPRCRLAPPLHTPRGVSGSTIYALVVAAHPKQRNQFALGLCNGDVLLMEPLESEKGWSSSAGVPRGCTRTKNRCSAGTTGARSRTRRTPY